MGCASFAQQKSVESQSQLWLGYMTNTRLSSKVSWWNDFHYVPHGFAVARTGISRHFAQLKITIGYGHLWLPGPDNHGLNRDEHRPWGQAQFGIPLQKSWTLLQRLRYDARFKEKIVDYQIADGFNFNHRVRYRIGIKKELPSFLENKVIPFLVLSNEILLNFGKEIVYNTFDQNRLSMAFGIKHGHLQWQIGYMNRYVQSSSGGVFQQNHTLYLWTSHTLDFRDLD